MIVPQEAACSEKAATRSRASGRLVLTMKRVNFRTRRASPGIVRAFSERSGWEARKEELADAIVSRSADKGGKGRRNRRIEQDRAEARDGPHVRERMRASLIAYGDRTSSTTLPSAAGNRTCNKRAMVGATSIFSITLSRAPARIPAPHATNVACMKRGSGRCP